MADPIMLGETPDPPMNDTPSPAVASPVAQPDASSGGWFSHNPFAPRDNFWTGLMQFGGNLANSANARTAGGHLLNGTGFLGPFASAIGQTAQDASNNAQNASKLALQQQQTQELNYKNLVAASDLPLRQFQNKQTLDWLQNPQHMADYWKAAGGGQQQQQQQQQGNIGGDSSTGTRTGVDPLPAPLTLAAAVKSTEHPNPAGSPFNSLGYVGNYQFGTSALQAAGLYKPAPGEDLTKNQWAGQITIPGYAPMTAQDFGNNAAAQDAAFTAHVANLRKEVANRGLDRYVGQTVGGVPVTQDTLAAMMQIGGPAGTQKFLETGGQYNPSDANGTSIGAYAMRVHRLTGGAMVAGPGAPTGTTAQAGTSQAAAAPQIASDPGSIGGKGGTPVGEVTDASAAGSGAGLPTPAASAPTAQNAEALPVGSGNGSLGGKGAGRETPAAQAAAPTATTAPQAIAAQPTASVANPAQQAAASEAAAHQARSNQLYQQATQVEQAQSLWDQMKNTATERHIPFMMPKPPGDPASLRTMAAQENAAAVAVGTAYPKSAAEGAGGAATKITSGRPGSITTDATGRVISSTPYPKNYTTPSGIPYQMLVDPTTDKPIISPDASKSAPDGDIPPGGTRSGLSQRESELQKQSVDLVTGDVNQDRKIAEDENEHIIGQAMNAKRQALQLKDLAPEAFTGAGGNFRSQVRAYFNQFAPNKLSMLLGDAAPAQEFNKIALMNAGTQERDTLGARGGFRATELYLHANPSLDMTEAANGHMGNVLAVQRQAEIDYAQGASNHYEDSRKAYDAGGGKVPYSRITEYDNKFTKSFNAQTYYAAMEAMNGKPDTVWAKGMTPAQRQIVLGIVQRTDPRAVVTMDGVSATVDQFGALTITPQDIDKNDYGAKGKLRTQ